MSEKKMSWLDWLLYFGSKDERNRRGADRAGHLAFWVAFVIALGDFLFRWPSVVQGGFRDFGTIAASLLIVLVSALVYTAQWVARGVTFADTPAQKKNLKILLVVTGFAVWGITAVTEFSLVGWWSVPGGLVAGVLASGLTKWLYQIIDRKARARAEAGLTGSGDGE